MNNDNLKGLYETLKREGYEPPVYEQFEKDMQDEKNLQGAYQTLKNEGYEPPAYETFRSDMGFGGDGSNGSNGDNGVNGKDGSTVTQQHTQPVMGQKGQTVIGRKEQPQYSQEVYDRYDNQEVTRKGVNDIELKSLEDIAAEMEAEKAGSSKTGNGLISRALGAFGQHDAQNAGMGLKVEAAAEPLPAVKQQDTQQPLEDPLEKRYAQIVQEGNVQESPFQQMVVELLGSGKATTPVEAQQMAYNLNYRYADKTGSSTVGKLLDTIGQPTPEMGTQIDNGWYNEGVQSEIEANAKRLGLNYDDYVRNHVKPAMQRELEQRYGYSEHDAKVLSGRMFENPEHVRKQMEYNAAGNIIGNFMDGAVRKEFSDLDRQASPLRDALDMSGESFLYAKREYNKQTDPDKILSSLLDKQHSLYIDLLTDSKSLNQIQARADALGIGLGDYLDQYVAPQLNNAIVEKFRQVGIERELPKDTMDYVLGGFEDSVGGMLLSRMMNGATRQEFKNEALAMTEAGENPYMDGKPGLLAQSGRLATGMAADFWLWGGWGKIGSKATQQLMKERIAHLAAERGVTEAVAYRLAEEEAGHYLKKGVVNNLFKHVPQSAITMSGAEATTAAVLGIRDRQDMGTIINNTVGQGVHGAFTGTAFGLTGGLMGGLTQGLTGAKRLLGKLAGLEVEAATLYTTEELARMANGEEAFDNPFEGLVESNVKLGFIKASANPVRAIGRLFDAVRHPVKALRAATESQHTLTDEDVADIMSSNDGRTLMDALTAMRPADNAREPGNRLGEVSVEDAEKSAAAYRDFMTDPDRPWIRKQKVARLLGGMLPPPGLEVSAEQVNNGDGTWSVRTRDYDGQTIRLDKYDSLYDADVAIDDMERDLDTNRTEALRQRIDMYDAYRNYSGYLEAEYETAVQKMRSGAELTDGEKQVVYLHQHRGEMLDIQNKLNDGEELSEEENRLGHIYTERFNDYVRRGSASDAFTREWEKANGLPEGSVEQAIYSPERDETQQRIADAYREAMEERIEELKNTRQERDDERTIEPIGAIEAAAQPQPAEKGIDGVDGVDGNNGSAGYLRGRAAIVNNDGGEMRKIGHEVNVADARIARMFSKEEAAAIYQAVESGDEVALAAVTQQQTEPAKRDAIMKLADALDAAKGMDAAFDEQTAGIEGEVRAEAERYQSEDGRIVPLTLSDGTTAFLMNGDPENEYGTVNVAYTDEAGQVQHKQIAARDITSIGEAEATDAYVARRSEELRKEQEGSFKNQIGGVDLRTGNTVELTMAGQTAPFRIDGFFDNGDLQLSDEGGEAMRMSRDEVIGMIRATEEKRVGEELDAEEKALKEAEKARKEAEKAEAERLKGVERDRRAQIEEIRNKVLKDSKDSKDGKDFKDFKDGDMGVMGVMGEMGEMEKYLLEHFDSEVDADAFIREQRVALRNYQRDEVQPKIDALQRDLDSYARSEREMTPEELSAVIQQHTQLMRQQEFLNGQAQKLKDASKRVGKIYSGKVGTQGLDATDSRSRRLLTLQKARSYEDKLKKARELYAGDAEASSLFDFESMEPKTIEEYAAEFLGIVPEQGKGIIDFESLQEETGHGGRRVGGDSRGYSAYLAPKGKGESIKALAHKMWERLPEQLHENWTDQDCRNALIEVLSSAQVPTDIRDYILNDRINQAEKYLRAQEEYEEEQQREEWAEAHHLHASDREAYEASLDYIGEEYSLLTDDDIQKINAIFAEKYESRDEQDRRSQEMDRQPVAAGDGGEGAGGQGEIRPLSSEILHTEDQGRPDRNGQDVGKDKDAAAAPVVSGSDVAGGAQGGVKTDGQGNPIDAAGKLIIEKVDRIDDITDEDFSNPTRSIELPKIPQNVDNAIGGDGKPVVIKKNILEKNSRDHSDLTPEQSREILFSALYNPSLYGQNRKTTKPHNWVVISTKNTEGKNRLVLLEVNNTKDNVEIVHWHYVRDKALETIKRQAEREGGQILILPSKEEAGGLSSRTLGSSSVGKDTENISNLQENGEKVAAKQQPAEKSASIQGIEGYDADEVLNAVRGDIEMKLEDAGIEGVTIKGMALHGSRMRGDAREDSDLDVVVEYEGDFSEDGLFNILNEVPTTIEGITVDINPITKGKSGTLEEYMERSRKYDEEKTPSRPPRGEEDKDLKGFKERLATAVEETNTEPTEGQKEAGNYKKGHLSFGGYNFTVENPKGSVRSGKDASGKPWSITMHNTYGYLTGKGHLGKDGDHLDVFINDDADLDLFGNNGNNGSDEKIYIIDQVNVDGSFDEHKIMWGFNSEVDAIRNYLMNYSRPWHGLGNITGVDKATFDKWVESSDRKVKPFAETRFGDKRDVAAKVMGEVKRRNGLRSDMQGNPVDANGKLIIEKVERIEEITDTDFTNPTRSIELPKIPQNVNDAIGAEGKPVIIKKNIFEKNANTHQFAPNESRDILLSALYNPDLVGQTQPKTRKNHWVAIKIDEKSPITVLEVNQNKDNVEVVGWYTLDDRNLTRIKRQAEREDGELLILTPKGAAASLSTLPSDLSAGKDTKKSSNLQGKGVKTFETTQSWRPKELADMDGSHLETLINRRESQHSMNDLLLEKYKGKKREQLERNNAQIDADLEQLRGEQDRRASLGDAAGEPTHGYGGVVKEMVDSRYSKEAKEFPKRIQDWLNEENLSKARGKKLDEIVEIFGNDPQPVAFVPKDALSVLGDGITDNRIYSGMGYFINHAVNHHPSISAEKYNLIQDVLSDPDDYKEIIRNGKRSVAFVKKIDRYNAVVVEVEKTPDGRIIWHKSFFDQKKEPYANYPSIRPKDLSSGGGVSPISHSDDSTLNVDKSVPGSSLPTPDDIISEGKVKEIIPNIQRKEQKNVIVSLKPEMGRAGRWVEGDLFAAAKPQPTEKDLFGTEERRNSMAKIVSMRPVEPRLDNWGLTGDYPYLQSFKKDNPDALAAQDDGKGGMVFRGIDAVAVENMTGLKGGTVKGVRELTIPSANVDRYLPMLVKRGKRIAVIDPENPPVKNGGGRAPSVSIKGDAGNDSLRQLLESKKNRDADYLRQLIRQKESYISQLKQGIPEEERLYEEWQRAVGTKNEEKAQRAYEDYYAEHEEMILAWDEARNELEDLYGELGGKLSTAIEKKQKQLEGMSDKDLLDAIGKEDSTDRYIEDVDRQDCIEEYDLRHKEEYDAEVESYMKMLDESGTELDEAYGMYSSASGQWAAGGYHSDERTKLRAQIDVLEDYIERKEDERYEREMEEEEREEEGAAAAQPQPTEKEEQYEADKEAVRTHGYDLTGLKMRDLDEGETSQVERRYVENGFFSFTSGERVESAGDVAFMFRALEDAAVENSFMVLIKDGVPTVVHLAIGNYNGVMAPIEQAFVAAQAIDPDSVVFVHNHPSGALNASREDKTLQEKIEIIFGNKARPGIIIDTKSGKYAEFSGNIATTSDRPQTVDKEVPVKVFSFSKQVFDKDWDPEEALKVDSSNSIAAFVSSHRLGEHPKMSLIVLNNQMRVTGNIFLPWTKLEDACSRESLLRMATCVNQMGGNQAVVYGDFLVGENSGRLLRGLSTNLKGFNVRLLDVMNFENRSAYESGVITMEPEMEYKGSAKEMMEAVGKRYHGKEMVFLNKTHGEEQILKDLGLYDEAAGLKGTPKYEAIMKDFRKNLEKTVASYNRDTKKIYIFAPDMTSSYAEEVFFHENIHAILDDWYGGGKRGIADRFWDVMPDDGKVSKTYVKEKSSDESEYAEEAFAYWLSRSMKDGDVSDFLNYFDDADKKRINNILKTLDYDTEEESGRRVRLRRNQHVSEAQSGYSETHQGTGGKASGGAEEEGLTDAASEPLPAENTERAARELATKAVMQVLGESGVKYHEVSQEEAQDVLKKAQGNGGVSLSRGKKRILEIAPLIPKEGSMADISSISGAKIIKNLDNGLSALQKIANGAENVPNAMTRDDLAQYGGDNHITFVYGKTGDTSNNFKGGYGLSHIGGKHGAETVLHVLRVIATGDIDRYVKGNKTVVLTDGEYEVLLGLTRFGEKETWLFNGWKKEEKTGANGEVSTHSDATQANPTFSREDLGAVLSDANIEKILETSKDFDGKVSMDFMVGQPGSGAPVFVSNALKAVEGIKQEKATPEQWLKMIEKNGGLKAGEDKWMGLSDWLNQRKTAGHGGSITKQEVLDFIRENQIQVEEVNYNEHIDLDNNPNMKQFREEFDDFVEKFKNEKEAVDAEMVGFNDEMYGKYGEGWAGKLSASDKERGEELQARYNRLTDGDPKELAFNEMVEKYGDDFGMAFEINYGNGKLDAQMDMYGDDISDVAKHFLQFEEQPINSTRLSYTTEGLENKREIALTVPTVESWNEDDEIHFGDAGGGRAVAWVRFGETEGVSNDVDADRYHDYSRKMKEAISRRNEMVEQLKRYKGGMLTETQKRLEEEETYIQQLRERYKDVADVKPTRVLVIDEIQSKRHQEGREKGYSNGEEKKRYQETLDAFQNFNREMRQKYGENTIPSQWPKDVQEEFGRLRDENSAAYDALRNKPNTIPDAPFEKNWHELAMKRMLRYAAENGYDKVAWTKGEQQAERYSLSKAFDSVEREDNPSVNGRRFVFSGRNVENFVVDDEGKVIDSTINDSKGKNLSELVGKDMAVKLMALENGDIIEDGLRIGGEGMKGFYDQMLPRFMDKYGKKWGVKTGEVKLPNVQAEGNPSGTVATMWAVDVTPEMRESVMQGQPMFSAGGKEPLVTSEGVVYGYTDGKDIYLTPEGINPETPAHEYGHLWVKAVKKNRPDLWENIKDLMRVDEHSQKVYHKLLGDENYSQIHDNEDKLYEEVLTQMGGKKNRQRFEQAAREVIEEAPTAAEAVKVASVISRIRRAFRKLWDWVGKSLFQIKKFRSVDEVTDRMMYDFVRERNNGSDGSNGSDGRNEVDSGVQFQVGKGKPRKMKGEGMAHYFERLREWDQREKAKKDAAEDGIMEPSREQADAKAHADWARDHAEWERNPDGKAEPMEWDYSQKAEKDYREALQAYEEKIDGYMPERTPELTKEDVIVEREMQVKTPAQKLMNDISEHLAREYDPYTARDAVKDAVIQRRKDIEEVSADDSIYIEGIRRETNRLADELMAKMGVDGARLKTVKLLQTMSDGKVKPQVTGADIRRALSYFIEAPMRRRDLANEANEALEHLGYPARFTADNIKLAEKELDAIRDEAQELLALHKEMAEDGRTEMTVEEQGLYGRVREGARKVADAMNGGGAAAEPQPTEKGPRIGADDVMATLSILTKRVKPEGLKVSEDMPELQPIIGKAKDWYAVAYGWLEDAGMRPDDIGYYKDYVNHVWDKERSDPEAYERYVANRQPTKSRNMRKREIRTLMEGEELGLVPKYDDIADLMGEYSKTNIQSWANKKMLVDLSGIDVVERDESGEPTSMMSLLTSRTPGAFDMDKYDYFEIAGVGPVWVHKAAAKNFGLVFETYEPGKLMGTYDKAASIAKNIELAWSGFHAAALTEVYVAQNVTRPKRATENFYKYLIHDSLLQGQPPAYADPELYKDAARHLVKLGATGDYAPEAMKQVSEQLKDFFGELRMKMGAMGAVGAVGEVVATAVKLVNEGMDKALWTWLHDGLKLCQYKMFREDVMAKAEKEGWSQDRINKALDEAGQYINDEFGGQHFEVIGVSPKTLRMMRRFLLSPDWLLSTQRHFLATFGFGSIYNKANVRNFRDFYRNVWHRGKGNEGQYDGRYSRAKASLACYVLGCMIMYPLVMNALNALLRKKDEEYEAQMEQENPGYVSKYKLAYPEGMKGFEVDNLSLNPFNSFNIFGDYGMGSNAEGKKSHLFAGRYGDDTEMYIRWGKQFREFPELFETEQGDLGFPGPLLKRLMGKSNPNIRFLYDTLNYYTRWDKSKSDEDLEAKWKAWIGDGKLQRNIGIPVGVGANKLWQNYLPFWVPTQSDKEWKPTDMILPSTKGFTPYKARNYFMEFIKAGDEDGIKETFKASVLNGMTSAQISRAFDAARKAVENESRELQLKDGNDIHSVTEAFDASQDLKERKELNSRIRKMLAADAEPPQNWNEFMTRVRAERDGTTEGVTKASEKYLMVATSADVLEDARLAQLKKKASEMKRIHDGMKDNKADGRLLRQWEQQNQKWLDVGKMIKDGESGSESKQGILFWKKQMTGKEANDRKALEMIRKKRKSLLKAVGERVK